jgi:hypothetical protein
VWIRLHLIERRIDRFGILSLTKIWDSLGGKMGKVKIAPPDQSPKLMEVFPCILDSAHIEDQEDKAQGLRRRSSQNVRDRYP